MCYVWEDVIDGCQHCSETDYQAVLRAIWNMDRVRPTHGLVVRLAQRATQDHPQWPRHDAQIGFSRDLAVENKEYDEQDVINHAQSFSSSNDAPVNQTAQRKRQRTTEDPPSYSRYDAPTNDLAQHKRQKIDATQHSFLRPDAGVNGPTQHGQQGQQACSSRQGAHVAGTAQSKAQARDQGSSYSSLHGARSDGAKGRGRKQSHQVIPSSSRHHAITDPTDEESHQETSQKASQDPIRIEDMELVTTGMNKIPPPCWEEERIVLPLALQDLSYDEFYRRQERELDDIWGLFGKEREALATSHTPEPEAKWEPVVEEEDVLERKVSLEEDVWIRSMLARKTWMCTILDEDEDWLREAARKADIWTREESGMLSGSNLKKLSRIFTLRASLEGR